MLILAGLSLLLAFFFAVIDETLKRISPRFITILQNDNISVSPLLIKVASKKVTIRYLFTFLYFWFLISCFGIIYGIISDYFSKWSTYFITSVGFGLIFFIIFRLILTKLVEDNLEVIANRSAYFIWFLYKLLRPLTIFLNFIAKKFLPEKLDTNESQMFEAKLLDMVAAANQEGVVDNDEQEMIESIVELDDTKAKDVMVPRSHIVCVEVDDSPNKAISVAVKSGHSRIPVIEGKIDNPVGILYLKDIVSKQFLEKDADFTISEIMRPPVFMPVTKCLTDILDEMRLSHNHMVLLVDEYGGLAGLLTIEDILEEIVGEIKDEYDTAEIEPITELGDNLYRVSARLSIHDLNKLFDLDIEEEDVDTISGLLSLALERVPVPGAKVKTHGLKLLAEGDYADQDKVRINTILVAKDDGTSLSAWNPIESKLGKKSG